MIHIALEGRCFVLAACQFAQEKDYPEDHPTRGLKRDPENVMIAGGSVIVSPLGKVLAGPLLEGEGVLTAEIDLNDCVRGKFDLDVVGHYARRDGELLSLEFIQLITTCLRELVFELRTNENGSSK
jgi:beta-cyano-L-alanine hydratase/nitrilase